MDLFPGAGGNEFGVFHFRRVFELNATPSSFVVHVSADNRYRLYVNGQQVSSGPQRSDVMHWRYETVDLAPQLRAGRNVIAALVWNWGADRPVAQFSRQTAFLLQGDSATRGDGEHGAGVEGAPRRRLRADSASLGDAVARLLRRRRRARRSTRAAIPGAGRTDRLHRRMAGVARGGRPRAPAPTARSSRASNPLRRSGRLAARAAFDSRRWKRRRSGSRPFGAATGSRPIAGFLRGTSDLVVPAKTRDGRFCSTRDT